MKNLITNNYYSGGNLDILAEAGYTEDDSLCTFKQAMKHFEVPGDMLKGLKGLGTTLCFYKEQENKDKNDGRCVAITSGGARCKNEAVANGYCTIHAKVEQSEKEVQCSKIKSNGDRCKMKTKAKSGLCFYHD